MMENMTRLVVYQLLGEALKSVSGLPLSGAVIGMVLLLFTLLLFPGVPSGLLESGRSLLKHLQLLFVPAGAGIIVHLPLVQDEWLPIGVALVISTVTAIAVTALVMAGIERFSPAAQQHPASTPLAANEHRP